MTDKPLQLDKHPVATEPIFFIIVLAAGMQPIPNGKIANVEFFQHRIVAYTREEAIKGVLKFMQAEQPNLYARGAQMGGWHLTHSDGIPARDMERLFKERSELERTKEKEADRLKSNALLKEIIDTKNVALFHTAIKDGRINHYERLYVHDELTKDMPDELAGEILKSPFMQP